MENEKFIRVDLLIDTRSQDQIQAFNNLLLAIGKVQANKSAVEEPVASPSAPGAEAPATPAPEKRKRSPKKTSPEPEQEAASAEEASAPKTETSTETPEEYTVELVREKLKEKVTDHRSEIKTKLTELGAPNVSSLDPAKYADFMNFLNSLS